MIQSFRTDMSCSLIRVLTVCYFILNLFDKIPKDLASFLEFKVDYSKIFWCPKIKEPYSTLSWNVFNFCFKISMMSVVFQCLHFRDNYNYRDHTCCFMHYCNVSQFLDPRKLCCNIQTKLRVFYHHQGQGFELLPRGAAM